MKFSGDDESAMMSTDVLGQDENDLIENYHKEQHDDLNAIFPCLVVMCGSGFACHKVCMTKRITVYFIYKYFV